MDIRKIKKLIELLEESGIAEIEIKEGEEAVRISRMPPAGSYPVHPARTGTCPGTAALERRCRSCAGGRARAPAKPSPTST